MGKTTDVVSIINSIHEEDWLIFAFANLGAEQHKKLHEETNSQIRDYLTNHDLKSLNDGEITDFINKTNLYEVLDFEESSLNNNPYSTFALTQRLYYLNHEQLKKISRLRLQIQQAGDRNKQTNIDLRALEEELARELTTLREKLAEQLIELQKEIADVNSRTKAISELVKAFEARGLLKYIRVEQGKNKQDILEIVEDTAKAMNRVQNMFLDIFHHSTLFLKSDLLFISAFLNLLVIIAALICCRPSEMGIHDGLNFLFTMISKIIAFCKDALDLTGFFVAALKPVIPWLPVASMVSCFITFSVSISNIVKANLDYDKNTQLLDKLANDAENWLKPGTKLTPNEEKIKFILLSNLSIKQVCLETKPEAIKALFTHEEFIEKIQPELVKHAASQKNKVIYENFLTAGLMLFIIPALIVLFIAATPLPALSLIVALVLTANFIGRLILSETALKSKESFKHSALQSHYVPAGLGLDDKKGDKKPEPISLLQHYDASLLPKNHQH